MIFPDEALRYADPAHRIVLQRVENFYAGAITHNQTFWAEANIDTQFLTGSQDYYNTLYGPPFPGKRKNFYFNHIRPIVNQITGRQRQQRKTTVVLPQLNADDLTADQLSKVMMWVHENANIYESISQAFYGACTTGLSLLHVYMDYRSDCISGDIRVDVCPYNSYIIDPFFTKTDFSDCAALWKRSYLTRREVMSLLPSYSDLILDIPINNYDGKFNFNPNNYALRPNNKMVYDEFWYQDYREQTMLIDPKTGESMEWRGDKEKLDQFLMAYPDVQITKTDIPTVRCAIIVENVVILDNNINGIDRMPFVPCMGYYNPELPNLAERLQGVVRALRDPQFLYNRRLIIESDSLEATINSGWMYKEDALVDPNSVFECGNGKGIAIKKNFNIQESIQKIPQEVIPPTTQELRKAYSSEMPQISGVSEELMGAASDDVAGVLSMLRQGAGLVSLQGLFDQLDFSQKALGHIILDLIQTNFMPGKVQNILGEGVEMSPAFYSRLFGKYNCVIEEGMLTATQKQMQFAQLMELRKLGVAIPDDVLIDSCTVTNKTELMESIKKQQESAQQAQQQQMQVEQQELQARAELAQAKAQADRGLAIERVSRVEENEALAIERKAAAKKDEEIALLNMVRALKEIEQIDIDQLQKLIMLSKMLSPETTAGQGNPVQQKAPAKSLNPKPMASQAPKSLGL